jgi:peptide/nickel transport system substrate-binding protein
VSRDGLEYVFKLRRGVVFHDGSPFTAHDVKFRWEAICHRDNVRIADAYGDHYMQIKGCKDFHDGKAEAVEGIEGVEVVDDHTLRVRLTEPYARSWSRPRSPASCRARSMARSR